MLGFLFLSKNRSIFDYDNKRICLYSSFPFEKHRDIYIKFCIILFIIEILIIQASLLIIMIEFLNHKSTIYALI